MKYAKKLLLRLCTFLLIFSLSACGKDVKKPENDTVSQAQDMSVEQGITPLLYKATGKNGNVCWLFGSIHVGEENFFPLPDYVMNAYNEADSLAVECDVIAFEKNYVKQMKVLQAMIFKDGSSVSDYVSPEVYERAVEILEENGMYTEMMDYYYPVMWGSLIDNFLTDKMDVDYDLGIDLHLMNKALEENKEILEVESVEFQYNMMANYSMELQAILLESSIASYDNLEESKKSMKDLIYYWKSGNETEFVEYINSETDEMTDEEKVLYEEYNDAMIVQRNIGMADYAEEVLKSEKKVFICVGAAHVVGDGGIADLLQERGYTVELVK